MDMPPPVVKKKSGGLRPVLTVIAVLMVAGLTIQVGGTLLAYRQVSRVQNQASPEAAEERAYLQDVYQTYGIRAASRAEAELLLADMQRKEQAERQNSQQSAEQAHKSQEIDRQLSSFERENRQSAAYEAQQHAAEAQLAKAEEAQRKLEQARLEQERIEVERQRWNNKARGQSPDDD